MSFLPTTVTKDTTKALPLRNLPCPSGTAILGLPKFPPLLPGLAWAVQQASFAYVRTGNRKVQRASCFGSLQLRQGSCLLEVTVSVSFGLEGRSWAWHPPGERQETKILPKI